MDIAGLSTVMSESKVMEQASISLIKISMDTGKENVQNMTNMLEKVASPNLGQHLDIRT